MLIGIDASRSVIARRTGTEAYSLHVIRELVRLDRGHCFRLYFNAMPTPGLFDGALEQRVIPFPRLWTHLRLSGEMVTHPPDVLWVPSHVLPLVHPKHSVVTVHDLGHRYYPQSHTAGQRRYLEWSTRYHVRSGACLIADSCSTRDDLVELYGADRARITVAHLGVDPKLQPVGDVDQIARVRKKYGIESPYLLYVGTIQPRKNLSRLITAFAALVSIGKAREHVLVLAGKPGWLTEHIYGRIQELGMENRVLLTGYVDDADLAALYSGAELFVMPSLYEGFGLPALEAMACGTPVVCSSVSSMPEVAGDAALLFDPHDGDEMAAVIARGLEDVELRSTLVSRGLKRVKQYTWKRCAEKVLDALEQCIQN